MISLYSYDVFDTLITRKTATPKGIFSVMQNTLKYDSLYSQIPEYLKHNFYYIRVYAESYARRYVSIIEEVTLEQIYSVISKNYSLNSQQKDLLFKLECDIEKKFLYGIPKNISDLKTHVANGDRVILISDMYLPKNIIQNILNNIDPIFKTIPLYVSSEIGMRKTTGNIYRYIQQIEHINYSSWTHNGDNVTQDILIPKRIGIHTIRCKQYKLLGYESNLIKQKEDSFSFQLLIGLCRKIRIEHENSQMAILSSIGFAALYPYVSWIIDQAINKHILDLYFISRDGYVLKIIADSIISTKHIAINTHYIYGSRDAWRIPETFEEAIKLYEPKGTRLSSVQELSHKLGIDYSLIADLLPKKYLTKNVLSEDDFKQIFQLMKCDDEVLKQVSDIWSKKKNAVIAYTEQEINFDSDSFAFVDVGGTGLTIDNLQKIVAPIYSKPLRVFYLTISGKSETVHELENQERYCWYGHHHAQLLLESLCRAPHSKCIGYYNYGDVLLPKFENDMQKIYEQFHPYFNMLVQLSSEYAKEEALEMIDNEQFMIFDECMNYLSSKPDSQVLEILGNIPFEYDPRSKEIQTFAPKLSLICGLSDIMTYIRYGHNTRTSYLEYSLWRGCYILKIMGNMVRWYRVYGSYLSDMISKTKSGDVNEEAVQ